MDLFPSFDLDFSLLVSALSVLFFFILFFVVVVVVVVVVSLSF